MASFVRLKGHLKFAGETAVSGAKPWGNCDTGRWRNVYLQKGRTLRVLKGEMARPARTRRSSPRRARCRAPAAAFRVESSGTAPARAVNARPPNVRADRHGGWPISTTDYPNRADQRRHSVETMLAGKTSAGPAGMVGPEGVPVPYRVPKVRHCHRLSSTGNHPKRRS